ncbi:MAG: nucleotidyltransferase domain-containing protein [Candidatus Aenigmarchaeota archaeon]|nr:nucleotidyltransferase domain-containing protein [Candidatus Aenigmarchaeota archaeon]
MAIDELAKELVEPFLLNKGEIELSPPSVADNWDEEIKKKDFYSRVIEFTNRIKKMYGDQVKSVLIFGSAARGDMKATSDIDLWVVVDDTATKSSEDVNRIRAQLQIITTEMKGLHIQMTPLTEFWAWMKRGSPELFNFLRVGLVIYDTGFVKPVQRMLKSGLLPPSDESIGLKARSGDAIIKRVELGMKTMVFDLRYAATDACQSVIMYLYKEAPDQRNMPDWLEKLVKDHKLESEYVDKFKELNALWKDMDHERIKAVEPQHLDKAMKLSKEIIDRMKKFLPNELKEYDFGLLI